MTDYARITHSRSESEVNVLLGEGWQLIDTFKTVDYDGSTSVTHVMGLSYQHVSAGLLEIIRSYEENGFKDQLFNTLAEKNDDNLSYYEQNGFFSTTNELTKFMSMYENLVNDKRVTYFKKEKRENFEIDETEIEF